MKKRVCLFFLMSFTTWVYCQDVLINGSNQNRLLNWGDFTGKPDPNSVHHALTKWGITYSYRGYSIEGGIIKIKDLAITLALDQKYSWVKPGKETEWLLKHEQGHFDVGLLCQQEMIERLNNMNYKRNEFPAKLQSDFNDILNKYILLNIKYDDETKHSQNKSTQETWNDYFLKTLKAR